MLRRYPGLIGCATLAALVFASPADFTPHGSAQEIDVRAGQTEVQVDRPTRQAQREQRRNRQIADWLIADQRSLIELAEFGLQKSKTPEVRQLAENLIRDHQTLVEKLEQEARPDVRPAEQREDRRVDRREDRQEDRRDAARDGDDEQRPLENLAERVGEGLERIGEGAERVAERARDAVERNLDDDDVAAGRGGAAASWVDIHGDISRQLSKLVRDDLEQREGAEFDAAFVGMIVAAHLQQRASLEVLSQRASGELATTLRDAQETVEQHQRQAEQTMSAVQRP